MSVTVHGYKRGDNTVGVYRHSDGTIKLLKKGSSTASLTLTDKVAGASACTEIVELGSLPGSTDNLVITVTGSVEGNSTSTSTQTVSSSQLSSTLSSISGTGGGTGMEIEAQYKGNLSPKQVVIVANFDRASSSVTITVQARDSSNTVLAQGSITSGLGTPDCGD